MNKIVTLSIIATTFVLGANIPNAGDIYRQVEKPKFEEETKALPEVKSDYKAPLVATDSFTTLVKDFTFSGNSAISSEVLAKLIEPYKNQELGLNKLKEITSIITKYYRDSGYFVAKAYLPEQKIKDGIVQIAIIEGTYGNSTIKNSSLVSDDKIKGYMDYLKNGQTVSSSSLERQMLLINDLNGVIITSAEVQPGSAVGTSDFIITTEPTNRLGGYAVADNYGSRYTGQYRLSAGVDVNSITGSGDKLSVAGIISNTANLKNGYIGYERALGYSGFIGNISYSKTKYKLDHISNYDAFGLVDNVVASLLYPIEKTRTLSQNIALDYSFRKLSDSSGLSGNTTKNNKSLNSITLRYDEKRGTNFFSKSGRLYTNVGLTLGRVSLDNDQAKIDDELINTQGNYAKLNLDIIHNQLITQNLSLKTALRTQKSFGKNLDSSEDLSVGGASGVRAYEDSELSGDQGYVLSLDLIYALPSSISYNHHTSIFIDNARVWKNEDRFNDEKNDRTINDVGIGYDLNYKNFSFRTTYAYGFGKDSTPQTEAEFSTNKSKILAQAFYRF